MSFVQCNRLMNAPKIQTKRLIIQNTKFQKTHGKETKHHFIQHVKRNPKETYISRVGNIIYNVFCFFTNQDNLHMTMPMNGCKWLNEKIPNSERASITADSSIEAEGRNVFESQNHFLSIFLMSIFILIKNCTTTQVIDA